jgi:predicted transcriptional regulator
MNGVWTPEMCRLREADEIERTASYELRGLRTRENLIELFQGSHPQTAVAIAHSLGFHHSTIRRALAYLRSMGYVRRARKVKGSWTWTITAAPYNEIRAAQIQKIRIETAQRGSHGQNR